MDQVIVHDGPEDRCFGCGHQNPSGLRLTFHAKEDGSVECTYVAPAAFRGAPGVVHGGIQAVLLDEVLGIAVHVAAPNPNLHIVTVDFRLRYRQPVPTGSPLRVRGRLVRSEERDYFAEGEILDEAGRLLTQAEARWRSVGERTKRPR